MKDYGKVYIINFNGTVCMNTSRIMLTQEQKTLMAELAYIVHSASLSSY